MQQNSPLQPHIYRPRGAIQALTLFFLLIGAVCFIWGLSDLIHHEGLLGDQVILGMFLGILLLVGGSLLLNFTRTRLEVSEQGLTLSEVGFQIYTPWQQVEQIRLVSHPLYRPRQTPALLLRSRALLHRPISEGKHTGVAVIAHDWGLRIVCMRPESYRWSVPLSRALVAPSEWEQGALGAFLRQYAPWVLIGASEHAPEP